MRVARASEIAHVKVFLLEHLIERLSLYEEHPAWETADLIVARDELRSQLNRQRLQLELELA